MGFLDLFEIDLAGMSLGRSILTERLKHSLLQRCAAKHNNRWEPGGTTSAAADSESFTSVLLMRLIAVRWPYDLPHNSHYGEENWQVMVDATVVCMFGAIFSDMNMASSKKCL